MAMWQSLVNRKISWDFSVLGKVTRNKGRSKVLNPSEGVQRKAVICLTLMTSNPDSPDRQRYPPVEYFAEGDG
jgi:hypothetical protein